MRVRVTEGEDSFEATGTLTEVLVAMDAAGWSDGSQLRRWAEPVKPPEATESTGAEECKPVSLNCADCPNDCPSSLRTVVEKLNKGAGVTGAPTPQELHEGKACGEKIVPRHELDAAIYTALAPFIGQLVDVGGTVVRIAGRPTVGIST